MTSTPGYYADCRQGPVAPIPEPTEFESVHADPVSQQSDPVSQTKSKGSVNGKHRISGFNPDWKSDFPWVEQAGNGMKCKVCVRHQRRPKKVAVGKAAWVDVPCTWLTRDALNRHKKSEAHAEAMAFEANRTKPAQGLEASVGTAGNLNKRARIAAFRCLYWLVKRELPHTTNYKPLLELCQEQDVSIISNLHQGENNKAESQRFIQEAVLTMARVVRAPILKDLRASPWYSIMIDETTDVAVVKEMNIYARYLKGGKSRTEFLTILPLPSGSADCIVSALTEFLQQIDLPLQKMCALGSDGASVMVGKHNGVGAQLRRQVPHILSHHCVAHRLALAVGQAAKGINYLPKFKDILGQLHRFYANSSVRMDGLRQVQELYNDPILKLSQAKDVRWLSHDKATHTMKRCLPSVFTSLEREAEERNDSQAMGLSVFVQTPKFIQTLSMCDILPHMSALSKAMQGRDVIFTTVRPLVNGTISLLRQLQDRPGEHYREAGALITSLRERDFNIRPATEQQMSSFTDQIYRPFIGQLIENIEQRFPDLPVLEKFDVFSAANIPEEDNEEYGNEDITALASHFGLDERCSLLEWAQIKATIGTSEMACEETMEWVAGRLGESHPNLHSLAAIGLLLPTSTADCERGFSCLNRVKTTHRASLSNPVLNALLTISLQGPAVANFDFDAAVLEWFEERPRRTSIFK